MKKVILGSIAAATLALTGCQAPYNGGSLYSNLDAPLSVRDNATDCSKKGESSMINVLGLIAIGDASVAKAKSSAGITKVGNVDFNYQNILGIFSTTTTKVCGD